MFQSTYYIPKMPNAPDSEYLAAGMAALLQSLMPSSLQKGNEGVRMENREAYFELTLPNDLVLQAEWLMGLAEVELVPFLKTKKEIPPEGHPYIRDADAEKDDFWAYTNARKEMKLAKTDDKQVDSDQARSLDSMRPRSDYGVLAFVSDLRMQGLGIHNTLVARWWESRSLRHLHLETILQLFALPPSEQTEQRPQIIKQWEKAVKAAQLSLPKEVTASQLFNPYMGKGQNRPKADAVLRPDNEKVFWLLEYLKVLGLYHCAAPRLVRDGNFRKTYALSPQNMAFQRHKEIFKRFREIFWNETAIRMDILAALLYTKVMLDYTEAEEAEFEIDWWDTPPTNYVRGFQVATYQLLSAKAYTLMNLSFINLPKWAVISTALERETLKAILEEHIARLSNPAVDERHSDGYHLLLGYREFISTNEWAKLFDFLIAYGQFVLSQVHRKNYYVQAFTEKNLRSLLMTQLEYVPILQNRGFQRVAEAIRRSTVIPIYQTESIYEIRFDLSQKLKRAARYEKTEFLEALTDFMHTYNEENVLKYRRFKRSYRSNLMTSDVEAVVQLVDDYDSPQLICNLLLAYGFARNPKETQTQLETQSETQAQDEQSTEA